jgi:recombination protein RecT
MRRSGALSTIRAVTVHAKDAFKYREGLNVELFHEPYINGDAGELKFVYVVLKFRDGGTQVTVMSQAQIEAVRRRSNAGSDGPWVTDYEEMAKKTVIRRAAKLAPMSAQLLRAIEAEDDVVDGEVVTQASAVLDAEAAVQRKTRRLVIEDAPEVSSTGEPPADVKLPTV